MTQTMLKPLAAAALLLAAGASHAGLTVYTTQSSFLAATLSSGVDGFTGVSTAFVTASPLTRNAGSFSYTASTQTSGGGAGGPFFGANTAADPWLSTNTAQDSIVFSSFSANVSAIGGLFFGTDSSGVFSAGTMTLLATDSTGASLTRTITAQDVASGFMGFTSTGTITSLKVTGPSGATPPFIWATVDNLTLGVAAPVPEVQTYAMMLAGLAAMGFIARRRRG